MIVPRVLCVVSVQDSLSRGDKRVHICDVKFTEGMKDHTPVLEMEGMSAIVKKSFETLVTPIILYECEVWVCNIARESWRKIEHIQNNFMTYNLKIKGNTPYHILLLEASLSPIVSMTMTRYLMYKNNLNNMEYKRIPKISSKSSHNHH